MFSLPQGAKSITVTQGTSPSGVAEVCDEYLFGRAKTGNLGLVSQKKRTGKKTKWVLLDPILIMTAG